MRIMDAHYYKEHSNGQFASNDSAIPLLSPSQEKARNYQKRMDHDGQWTRYTAVHAYCHFRKKKKNQWNWMYTGNGLLIFWLSDGPPQKVFTNNRCSKNEIQFQQQRSEFRFAFQSYLRRRIRCFSFGKFVHACNQRSSIEKLLLNCIWCVQCAPIARDRKPISSFHHYSIEEKKKKIRIDSEVICLYSGVLFRMPFPFVYICRAIPEAGYITLGTIRYGIKLANGSSIARHSSASMDDNNALTSDITTPKRRRSSCPHSNPHQIHDSGNQCAYEKSIRNTNESPRVPIDSDEPASLSDVSNASTACSNCSGFCCIDATKIPLPWTSTKMANADAGECCDFVLD